MSKLLSIIIPSYNTEKYIDFCLPFFLNNNELLEKTEILIINDGSLDFTLRKVLGYSERYPDTIKVIDKENGGHGSTINIGIKKAIGKYVKVVDGDDWVDSNNLLKLVHFLDKSNCDMIYNPYITHNEKTFKEAIIKNKFTSNYKFYKTYKFDEINFDNEWLQMHSITYKTEILKKMNLTLDENTFYVDVEYILYPIPHIETICFLDFPIYIYRINSDQQSVSIQGIQKNMEHHRRVIDSCLNFFYSLDVDISDVKKKYIKYRIIRLINTQYNIFFTFPPDKKISKELQSFNLYIQKEHKQFYFTTMDNVFVKIYKKNNNFYKWIYYLNKLRLKFLNKL